MPLALIGAPSSLAGELGATLLWRDDVERQEATTAGEVRRLAEARPPDVIVIDRDLEGAEGLVTSLRAHAATRHASIVIVARDDFDPVEAALVASGANGVLRLPAGPEWDERLTRLLSVPARRDVRLPVELEVEARFGQMERVAALALNLSLNGMLLDCSHVFEIGEDLDFRFQLPETDDPIVGAGRVARRAGSTRYGIEFYGLEGDGPDIVRWFVGERGR